MKQILSKTLKKRTENRKLPGHVTQQNRSGDQMRKVACPGGYILLYYAVTMALHELQVRYY